MPLILLANEAFGDQNRNFACAISASLSLEFGFTLQGKRLKLLNINLSFIYTIKNSQL